jgi:hypothetical protein
MNDLTVAMAEGKGRSAGGSGFILLDDKLQHQQRSKRMQNLVNSWPIAAGMVLAVCAPFMSDALAVFKPYGMWLVFPFVELVGRPELHMGAQFREMAPQVMLFLQFPLEGLMAKKFLKGRVTLGGVTGQVFLYHLLGAIQLWLVYRTLGGGPVR